MKKAKPDPGPAADEASAPRIKTKSNTGTNACATPELGADLGIVVLRT